MKSRSILCSALLLVQSTSMLFAALPMSEPIESIPTPPEGKRWVVNEQYSDEFNGSELDKSKWYHKHRSGWGGREPARFLSKNLKVEDGYLKFWGSVEGEEIDDLQSDDFFLGCATITSVMQDAHFGYYESRYKVNKTTLGSGFWMSSYSAREVKEDGYDLPAQNRMIPVTADTEIVANWESIPEESQKSGLFVRLDDNLVKVDGKKRLEMLRGTDLHHNGQGDAFQVNESSFFRQELDINESVGVYDRNGSWASKRFATNMSPNVHFWFMPNNSITTNGERRGGIVDVRIDDLNQSLTPNVEGITTDFDNAVLASEDFNTYGCWWRDESSVTFYLDNAELEDKTSFADKKGGGEFVLTDPMSVNLTSESYYIHSFKPSHFIWYPQLDELATPEKSTTLYDWVRSYYLVNSTSANPKGTQPMVMFESKVHIANKPATAKVGKVELNIHYTASTDMKLLVVLYNKSGKEITSKSVEAYAGYANTSVELDVKKGGAYSVAAYIGTGGNLSKSYISGDSFSLSVE